MRPTLWLIMGMLAFCVSGCGGGGGGDTGNSGGAVSVSVSPSVATVAPGGAQAFTDTVTGSANTAVTWSVQEGAPGGSITSNGQYTASALAGTYHVVATSQADATKVGIATIIVPVVVTVSPQAPVLTLGQTQTFTARVIGISLQAVTWSVQEGAAGGSITANGTYTAPLLPGTYHVVATSQLALTQQGIATITVQAGSASGTIQ